MTQVLVIEVNVDLISRIQVLGGTPDTVDVRTAMLGLAAVAVGHEAAKAPGSRRTRYGPRATKSSGLVRETLRVLRGARACGSSALSSGEGHRGHQPHRPRHDLPR
ncbi:hypothetical protein [Streptomyces sp. NPDC002994]|uniref:hypothetical protein n=1 Tax=Streptomyces sp. NPDC002994 TaxID=3154441 RepID=UPI0033B5CA41